MDRTELPSFDFESYLKSSIEKMDPHPVMDIPDTFGRMDLTEGFDRTSIEDFIQSDSWAIGGYLEKRSEMYTSPRYKEGRNIHMGIDIWAKAGQPVYAALNGSIAYSAFQNDEGNYGGTLILKHIIEGQELYVLYGHLSKASLQKNSVGDFCKKGEVIGWLGSKAENGNWPPHLHLQLSIEDPGEADMPGVVAKKNLIRARERYPNPEILLADIL